MPIIKLDKEERKISIIKEYKCDYCGKEFVKRESRIRGNHVFCSEECYSNWRHSDLNPTKTERKVICDTCGKIFITSGVRYNNNKHNYCCLNCANLGKKELWKDSELRENSRKRIIKNLNAGKYSFTKTTPQIICNNLLDNLSIQYINEYSVSLFSIDNYLPEYDLFIEVMGNFWHANPCFYSSIKYEQQARGCNRDRKKRLYIKEQMNKNILNLWESDIENDLIKCEALIKLYINNSGELKNYNSFNYSFENNELTLNNDIVVPFFEREDILENIA